MADPGVAQEFLSRRYSGSMMRFWWPQGQFPVYKSRMSRQQHQPTDEQRRTVRAMTAYGIPQPDIATVIGIDPKTLRLHYSHETDRTA